MKILDTLIGFKLSVEETCNYDASTITLYGSVVDQFARKFGNPDLSEITKEMVEDFFIFLQTKPMTRAKNVEKRKSTKIGVSGWTLTGYKKAIKVYFDWAVKEFGLKDRPDAALKLKHGNAREFSPYTKAELAAIIKVITQEKLADTNTARRKQYKVTRPLMDRDRTLVMLMTDTGISSEEACNLLEGDFNFEQRTIVIRTEKQTKGNTVILERTNRLCDKVAWAVQKLVSTRNKPKNPKRPIFLGREDYTWSADAIRSLFGEIASQAGVGEINYKRFRATFAVNYLLQGHTLSELKSWLGLNSHDAVTKFQKMLAAYHKANVSIANRTNDFLDSALAEAGELDQAKPEDTAKTGKNTSRRRW